MHSYPKETALAAKWVYEHRGHSIDWDWAVLSRHNEAEDSLNFPDVIAYQVWTIFAEKRMVLPKQFPTHRITGKPFWAYELNLADESVWTKMRRPPTSLDNWLFFPLQKTLRNFPLFLVWILSLVITSGVTYLVEKWIDSRYAIAPEKQDAKGKAK